VDLQLAAESFGVEFNDHYLRDNRDGSVTVTVFGNEDDLARLDAAGYELGVTIEGPDTWRARIEARQANVRAEQRADAAAVGSQGIRPFSHTDEIVVLRVDYFETYAGSCPSRRRTAWVARLRAGRRTSGRRCLCPGTADRGRRSTRRRGRWA
jgi:hypothetical protein